MGSIAEKFYTMEYGAAPEDPKEVVQWLDRHHRRFGEFIGGEWVNPASADYYDNQRSLHRRSPRPDRPWQQSGCGRRRCRRAQGAAGVASAQRSRARALSLRARPPGAEAFAPARRPRNHGQRQAHPREPRHRYSSRRPAFLSSCRLGAVAGAGVSAVHGLRRRRPGNSVELSAADVCVEGGSGAGRGQHGGHQAGQVHAAHRAGLCRAGHGSGPAAGRAERAHLRRAQRAGARRTSGRE